MHSKDLILKLLLRPQTDLNFKLRIYIIDTDGVVCLQQRHGPFCANIVQCQILTVWCCHYKYWNLKFINITLLIIISIEPIETGATMLNLRSNLFYGQNYESLCNCSSVHFLYRRGHWMKNNIHGITSS